MPGSAGENLEHEHYGSFEETTHTEIDLYFGEWNEGAQQAIEYKIGPPIAWEYDNGTLYLWGDNLDEGTLRTLSDACHALEQEFSEKGIYDAAQNASSASSKLSSAEVVEP